MTDLNPSGPTIYDTIATSINAVGSVVGWGYNPSGSEPTAYIWQGGAQVQLAASDRALAINDAGQIVGQRGLYSSGSLTSLSLSDTSAGFGQAINATGQIAGYGFLNSGLNHAFLWTPSIPNGTDLTALDLGALPGQASIAYGINNATASHSAQVVGDFGGAFLWDSVSGINDPGPMPPNGAWPVGFGVNDASVIVGQYQFPDVNGNWAYHAFVWDSSHGVRDLNILLPANSGWTLQTAYGINASGQIVGVGVNSHGHVRGFLLTPQ
jgi:probable HAF family extracellular repeat protein